MTKEFYDHLSGEWTQTKLKVLRHISEQINTHYLDTTKDWREFLIIDQYAQIAGITLDVIDKKSDKKLGYFTVKRVADLLYKVEASSSPLTVELTLTLEDLNKVLVGNTVPFKEFFVTTIGDKFKV